MAERPRTDGTSKLPMARGSASGRDGPGPRGRWLRWWEWLREAEKALSVTTDDLQDARIARLEEEVSALKERIDAMG